MIRRLRISLEEPVAVADGEPFQGFWRCLDYVPGTAIRGALAQAVLAHSPPTAPEFRALFLEAPVIFRNGYLEREKGRRALPAAAICPGEAARVTAHLTVSRWAAAAMQGQGSAAVGPAADAGRPGSVGGQGASPAGPLVTRVVTPIPHPREQRASSNPGPEKTLFVGTSIHRSTGTAHPKLLFGIEALDPGQTFLSEVVGSPEQLTRVERWLERLEGHLFLGAETSRGMGRVSLELLPDSEPGSTVLSCPGEEWAGCDSVAQAVESFTAAVHEELDRLGDWVEAHAATAASQTDWHQRLRGQFQAEREAVYIGLALASRLVLPDPWDLPDRFWDPLGVRARLTELGVPPETLAGLVLACGRLRSCVVSGWNQAWGLPKPSRPGLEAGGVAVYRCRRVPDQAQRQLAAALECLLVEGLGERRAEGFGELTLLPGRGLTKAGGDERDHR
ncbi:MAG: hypothetical protein K6T75_08570 [Acetobacteraceae bacterium]|nr:hypothetical protein [Acetobacteraceae bacterium]